MSHTRVVNLYKEPYDVYIGRAGRGEDGYYGNPVAIGKSCSICGSSGHDREGTIECFKAYFYARLASDDVFRERIHALAGRTLACFCVPQRCHGEVIAEYLNSRTNS